MKLRGWLLLLLFAHVLVHPLVHGMGASASPRNSGSIASSALVTDFGQTAGDQCELCRVAHSTIVTPGLPKVALLNPPWIRTTLQAVNYDSLQADRRLPSRAPPIL